MFRKILTIAGTLGIFLAGIAIIVIMNALSPKPNVRKTETVAPSVFYMVAKPETVTLDVNVQGEVRPRTDINLTAQVGGRVAELSPAFVDGGEFKKGDMLIKIEDADYRLARTRAQARVAQAEQALRQEQAESDLARRDWEELGNGSAPSDLTLRKPQLAQAQANYESAKADLDEAKLNLDRATIRAPFDGRVRTRIAGLGQFVSPGAQLGRIFATDFAEIRLPLTDGNLATLGLAFAFSETPTNPGPPVTLTAQIGPTVRTWQGRIARTEGSIDPSTRQIGAIAVVDDPYGAGADDGVPLAIGLFVNARIQGQPFQGAYIIPNTALYGRDTMYVIPENNILEQRTVSIASNTGSEVVVTAGLEVGDRVATSPLRGSSAGDEVTPVDPENPDALNARRAIDDDQGTDRPDAEASAATNRG